MEDNFNLEPILRKNRKNSKRKGNAFELQIAKQLNEHFKTDEFVRSPGSGAFSTTHKLPKNLQLAGDLLTPQGFRFIIECKKGYNQIRIQDLFSPSCEVWKFARQAEKDAKRTGKDAIIIWKQDRKKTLLITKDSNIESYLSTKNTVLKINKYCILLLEEVLKLPKEFWGLS